MVLSRLNPQSCHHNSCPGALLWVGWQAGLSWASGTLPPGVELGISGTPETVAEPNSAVERASTVLSPATTPCALASGVSQYSAVYLTPSKLARSLTHSAGTHYSCSGNAPRPARAPRSVFLPQSQSSSSPATSLAKGLAHAIGS